MRRLVMLLVLMSISVTASAAEEKAGKEKPLTPAERVAIVKAVAPSLVRVEITQRFDKGEAPHSSYYPYPESMGPSLTRYGAHLRYGGGSELIEQERPIEIAGLLVSPTRVLTKDTVMHPRFIKGIAVRFGDELVKARIAAYGRKQPVMFLELEKPFKSAKPLRFKPDAQPPYQIVYHYLRGTKWIVSVAQMPKDLGIAVALADPERPFQSLPPGGLVVDTKGTPVGVTALTEVAADDTWKGSPLEWPAMSAADMQKALAKIEKIVKAGVPRVTLYYRSAKKQSGRGMWRDAVGISEEQTNGIITDANTILILGGLSAKRTARLEKIKVHVPEGDPINAKFACTLADYGAFVATLEKPQPAAMVKLASGDIRKYRNVLLLTAEIRIYGEERVLYFLRDRITSFHFGWERKIYPSGQGRGGHLLFDQSGNLVIVTVRRRPKPSFKEGSRSGKGGPQPAAYMKDILSDLKKHADPSNVPLGEDEENRMAWLGLVLQKLDSKLARANNVSEITRDGRSGSLVSYVYPNSPAAKAGIKPGFILIRLHVEGYPMPIEIVQLGGGRYSDQAFPWDRLDRVPAEYLNELPKPWPAVSDAMSQVLTEVGFGKKFTVEFYHDGKVVNKDFTVVQSPRHYDSAPRHKSKALGLTVRDLTFEVQRYFQRKSADPGVIISKVEPGSKAYVSGLRPYEIISHVNDKPVKDAKEFAGLIKGHAELRLSVKRMMRGRVVKIKMDAPEEKDKEK